MAKRPINIDDYLSSAPEYARPLLKHFRALVHKACPQVEETIKWSAPTFVYHGMLCGMAAFKKHCSIGFWKDKLLRDPKFVGPKLAASAAATLDKLGTLCIPADLPGDRVVLKLIKEAMRLNAEGIKPARTAKAPKPPARTPPDLAAALKANARAKANFEAMSPSHKREYIEWVSEAKADDTRKRRIATTVEWAAKDKHRNWKYERC